MFRRWSITFLCPGLPGAVFHAAYFFTRKGAVAHARRCKMLTPLFDYRLTNERTGEEENL